MKKVVNRRTEHQITLTADTRIIALNALSDSCKLERYYCQIHP